jgi:hypothetical protein
MDVKRVSTRVEIKDADKGEFVAIIATLNVKDLDGDVTPNGAFHDGEDIVVSAYGHSSWMGALPVGDAVVQATEDKRRADYNLAKVAGQFYLDTAAGKDTFTTVKNLAAKGLGEWSYGYDVLKYSFGEFEGDHVRFLEDLKVFEASPVLQGAGVDTRTVLAKALKSTGLTDEQVSQILAAVRSDVPSAQTLADQLKSGVDALTGLIDSATRVGALRAEVGKPLSAVNQDLLKRAQDQLTRIVDLVGVGAPTDVDTDDATQREFLRFIRSHM